MCCISFALETSYRYPSGGGWRRRVPPAAAAVSLFDTLLALSLSLENKTSLPDTTMDFPRRNIFLLAVLCVVVLEVSAPSSSLRTLDEPILLDEEDEPSMPPEEGDVLVCVRNNLKRGGSSFCSNRYCIVKGLHQHRHGG